MMRNVLVLGTNGMLGSMLIRRWPARPDLQVWGAARGEPAKALTTSISRPILTLDAMNCNDAEMSDLRAFIETHQIQVVVNCMGVIKQRQGGQDPATTIAVNALFPHRVAAACEAVGARLIHVSTDCVFDGDRGNYSESDRPDAQDFYGRTKALGEVSAPHLTLRTSIIGPELPTTMGLGLLSWFWRQQNNRVNGFDKAIFSGVTTLTMADILAQIILDHPDLMGLYQLASAPIDKFTLLSKVKKAFEMPVEIVADSSLVIDRSLNGERLNAILDQPVKSWDEQISDLHRFMQAHHLAG